MAKPIGRSAWREARDAALQKKHNERSARIERNLYYYFRREIKKTWKEYAIIAGGAFGGLFIFLLWILYLHYEFNMKYGK